MRLITTPESNFGARVEIAARAKGLTLATERPPPGGVKSPQYLAINPIGRIPVLITEGGAVIPESQSILVYLEERFATPSLRPRDAQQRARIDVAIRIMDLYVMTPVIRLFVHLNPAQRDPRVVDQELERWKHGLSALSHFMTEPLPQAEAGLSLADCVLPPSLHLSARIAEKLDLKTDLLAPHEPLREYYSGIKEHPIIGEVLHGLTAAHAVYDAKASGPNS